MSPYRAEVALSVLLISPRVPQIRHRGTVLVRPMGLFSLVASLRSMGIRANVLDLLRQPMSDSDLIERVKSENWRMFGLTCNVYTRFEAIATANLLRKAFPDRPIIAGGPHFSKCAEDALQHVHAIDVIVRGEGEEVIQKLVPAMLYGGNWSNLNGISFRRDGHIQHNPDAPRIADLDSLPIFTDFRYEDYPEVVAMQALEAKKVPGLGIVTTRGCPHRCIFCSSSDGVYRTRSPESVVNEMEQWMDRFPMVGGFNIYDLTFAADAAYARAVCEEIMARQLHICWWAETRVDIDLDLLDLMAASGCKALSVGVESGSPRVLKAINKKIDLEMVYDFAARCDSLGIRLDVFLMLSLPTETADDLKMTLGLAERLLRDYKRVLYPGGGPSVTSIYSGSPLERIARAKGVIPPDFSWHKPFYEPSNIELFCSPYVPIYRENLSHQDLKLAVRKVSYQIDTKYLGWGGFVRRTVSKIFARDRTLGEKVRAAKNLIESFFSQSV